MDLPIDDKELDLLVWMSGYTGAEKLHKKLKLVKEVRDENPGGPYKRILLVNLILSYIMIEKKGTTSMNWCSLFIDRIDTLILFDITHSSWK